VFAVGLLAMNRRQFILGASAVAAAAAVPALPEEAVGFLDIETRTGPFVTPVFRLAYPHIHEPARVFGADVTRYGVTLLLDPAQAHEIRSLTAK
jgi:hypothetical protein